MLSNGFYHSITLPTRLGTNKCSLIDTINLKLSPLFKNAEAGILYTKISGYFPYFLVLNLMIGVRINLRMMTSSNGNIFRVTGHLCGEFTGPR